MTQLVAATAFAAKSDTPGTTVSANPTVGLPSYGPSFKPFLVQIENNGSESTEAKADYDIDHLVDPASIAITAVLPGISVRRRASTPSRHNGDKERCNNRDGDDQKTDAEPNENIGHLIPTSAAIAKTAIAIHLKRRAARLLISMKSLPVQENDNGDNRNERDFKKPIQIRPPNPQFLPAARIGVS